MKKYDVRFCSCGRIHFIEWADIEKAVESNKELLYICNNCGASNLIGADEDFDPDYGKMYNMYSYSVKNKIMTPEKIYKIVFSLGEIVIMETGGEATAYYGTFKDWETKKPEEVSESEWGIKTNTVNKKYTKNRLRDQEKWSCLLGYLPFFEG